MDDIPEDELIEILEKRCLWTPKYCTTMVNVITTLQNRRERSQVFHSFITPRDLLILAVKEYWKINVK